MEGPRTFPVPSNSELRSQLLLTYQVHEVNLDSDGESLDEYSAEEFSELGPPSCVIFKLNGRLLEWLFRCHFVRE